MKRKMAKKRYYVYNEPDKGKWYVADRKAGKKVCMADWFDNEPEESEVDMRRIAKALNGEKKLKAYKLFLTDRYVAARLRIYGFVVEEVYGDNGITCEWKIKGKGVVGIGPTMLPAIIDFLEKAKDSDMPQVCGVAASLASRVYGWFPDKDKII